MQNNKENWHLFSVRGFETEIFHEIEIGSTKEETISFNFMLVLNVSIESDLDTISKSGFGSELAQK